MTVTKAEYEWGRTTLRAAGCSEDLISRLLNKPKRRYSDSSWKEEPKSIYLKTGIITRQQIMSAKGFPTGSSNLSQTVNRFISWLESETGDTLTHDKKVDAWSVKEDLSPHYDFFINHMPMTKKAFKANCEIRGVDSETIMAGLQGRVRGLSNDTMELI